MRLLVLASVLALASVLVLAACSVGDDGGGATVEKSELKGLVLQPEDLSRSFSQFDEGRQAIVDRPTGKRSDPARFGRIDGWKSRYRRAGSARTKGPLVVVSFADVFESADGAKDELEAIEQSGYQQRDEPDVGDEARAWESDTGGVSYFVIAWREDNATASILASGFQGRTTFNEVLTLARKQSARMTRAAS